MFYSIHKNILIMTNYVFLNYVTFQSSSSSAAFLFFLFFLLFRVSFGFFSRSMTMSLALEVLASRSTVASLGVLLISVLMMRRPFFWLGPTNSTSNALSVPFTMLFRLTEQWEISLSFALDFKIRSILTCSKYTDITYRTPFHYSKFYPLLSVEKINYGKSNVK